MFLCDGLVSVGDLGAGGIPTPTHRSGLPCEVHLLSAASPRIPADDHEVKREVVNQNHTEGELAELCSNLTVGLRDNYKINDDIVIGLDIGTTSCAVAVLLGKRVEFLGVRLFESVEDPYTGQVKNLRRRLLRNRRVRLRRRAGRHAALRQLFDEAGMIPSPNERHACPYELRAEGLDRRLSAGEFAIALTHLAQRRGYVARKEAVVEREPEAAALGALGTQAARNEVRAGRYRTAGEMFARDSFFASVKRNREGDFRSVLSRSLVEREANVLFEAQRSFGSEFASPEFEQLYIEIGFSQEPAGDQSSAVGQCPYLPEERRGARHAPTIERYRFLDALTKLKLVDDGEIRRLTALELRRVVERFGRTAKVTRLDVRRWLGLSNSVKFADGRSESADIVSARGAASGTVLMRSVLGRAHWNVLAESDGVLDAIAAVLSFCRSQERLRDELAPLGLPAGVVDALVDAHDDGEFVMFRGAASLSAEAARRMVPYLEDGDLVFDAAIKAGVDPLAHHNRVLYGIKNPTVIRSVLETVKQVRAVIAEIGVRPGRIHVELVRDLGLGPTQRAAISAARRKRLEARATAAAALEEIAAGSIVSDAMVDRYLLWQEQGGRCVYTGDDISLPELIDGARIQVDHILPVSRSSDYSQSNTVVCRAEANQAKGNKTPFEWRGSDSAWWNTFRRRIEWMPISARKRRLLVTRDFSQREGASLARNLNDTSYAARCVLAALRELYPPQERYTRVVARPGQLTAILRRAWGFSKDRNDVRHHALDALMTAAASDRALYELASARQRARSTIDISLPLPWNGFRVDVLSALSSVSVSRSETRRGRGSGHSLTVRRFREDADGNRMLYERRPLHRLRHADLERVPDAEVNGPLIAVLRDWLDRGSPINSPPISPQGDPIRRVRLKLVGTTGISRDGVPIRGGIASYGDLVRIDVFDYRGKFAMVPIHAVHCATQDEPPNLAIVRGKLRKDWREIGADDRFLFSIQRHALIRITRRNGQVTEGFFRGADLSETRLVLADPLTPSRVTRVSIGAAAKIEKFQVDRLGRKFLVPGEVRTWRGRVVRQNARAQDREKSASFAEA
jgi:CRISPR-associated endonuclease Csn1